MTDAASFVASARKSCQNIQFGLVGLGPHLYRSRSSRIPLGRKRDCVPGRAMHGP